MARSYTAREGKAAQAGNDSLKNFKAVFETGVNSAGVKESLGKALYKYSKSLNELMEGGKLGDGTEGNGVRNADGTISLRNEDSAYLVSAISGLASDVMNDGLGEEGEHESVITVRMRDGTELGDVPFTYSVGIEEDTDEREVGWSYRDEGPRFEEVDVYRYVASDPSLDRGGLRELLRANKIELGEKEFETLVQGIEYGLANNAPESDWEDVE